MSTRTFAVGVAIAATVGLFFAGASTFDFVQHLDRQIHDLHCSFVPGLVAADDESTGCQVTLLSPYSSMLRTSLWGGIPISLPAMGIFALLLFRAIDLWARPQPERRVHAGIVFALSWVPLLASIVMGSIAYSVLHAACKLCIGIYIASSLTWLLALLTWLAARKESAIEAEPADAPRPPAPGKVWLAAAGHALAFTAVPVLGYAMSAPDHDQYIGTCGGLQHTEDPHGVMVELGSAGKGAVAIEVFDPLCPACKGFEERLAASGLDGQLTRRAVMFPLDSECNWMVTRSLHPGACRVSEAVLCAASGGASVDEVVQWAFDEQKSLTETAKNDPDAVTAAVASRFPALKQCLRSAEVKTRLNQSLRWVVANELTVLTPQVFVDGVKLCDEDTDLGLEYTLQHMLTLHDAGKLAAMAPAPDDAAPDFVPGSAAPPAEETPAGKPRERSKPKAGASPPPTAPKPAPRDTPPGQAPDQPSETPTAEPDAPTEEPDVGKGKLPGVSELPPPADDAQDPEPQEDQ